MITLVMKARKARAPRAGPCTIRGDIDAWPSGLGPRLFLEVAQSAAGFPASSEQLPDLNAPDKAQR